MRNLEQRIAEIHHRSAEIIEKRRKRRKHLLVACIPVVLCMGLVFGVRPLERATEDGIAPGSPPSGELGMPEMAPETVLSGYMRMEVTGGGLSRVYMEQERITSAAEYLRGCVSKGAQTNDTIPDETTVITDKSQEFTNTRGENNYSTAQSYTVILESAAGTSEQYLLVGDVLYEADGQQGHILTEKQAQELRSLLGIAEP